MSECTCINEDIHINLSWREGEHPQHNTFAPPSKTADPNYTSTQSIGAWGKVGQRRAGAIREEAERMDKVQEPLRVERRILKEREEQKKERNKKIKESVSGCVVQ